MTVRFLLVAIDDERPLGPQVAALRAVLPWKTIRRLLGDGLSRRWLHELAQQSVGIDVKALEWGERASTVAPGARNSFETPDRPLVDQCAYGGGERT